MALAESITVNGRDIAVRELTVAEVRDWLANLGQSDDNASVVDDVLFDDCALADLAMMTDLSVDEMGAFSPSELREVVDKAKGLNAHFFALTQRLLAVSQKAVGGSTPTQPTSATA